MDKTYGGCKPEGSRSVNGGGKISSGKKGTDRKNSNRVKKSQIMLLSAVLSERDRTRVTQSRLDQTDAKKLLAAKLQRTVLDSGGLNKTAVRRKFRRMSLWK